MKDERGAATVLACWAMLALIAVAALVIHLGSAVSARHRAQSAADLAALAAAAALERGTEAACAAATTIAGRMRDRGLGRGGDRRGPVAATGRRRWRCRRRGQGGPGPVAAYPGVSAGERPYPIANLSLTSQQPIGWLG